VRKIAFTLDRQEKTLYIFSDLWGFYLCGENQEQVLASIVPLVQHLFWNNERVCVVPKNAAESCIDLISKGSASIEFEEADKLLSPKIPIKGAWWANEDNNKSFFIPLMEGDLVDATIMAKIVADRKKDAGKSS